MVSSSQIFADLLEFTDELRKSEHPLSRSERKPFSRLSQSQRVQPRIPTLHERCAKRVQKSARFCCNCPSARSDPLGSKQFTKEHSLLELAEAVDIRNRGLHQPKLQIMERAYLVPKRDA